MDPSISWTVLCSSAQSHAAIAANGCSPEVAEMILAETASFCRQAPPTSREELGVRYMQSNALTTAKIGNLTYADMTARSHPGVARWIIDATKELCQRPLPNSREESDLLHIQSMALVSVKISTLTYADITARSHPTVANQILDATQPVRELRIPVSRDELNAQHQVASAVTVAIGQIVFADSQRSQA
jgi:hypothetical protein